jgi:cysteine desulfurase
MLHLPVYLDYNATTPCDPAVVAAMLPYFGEQFGNAASRQHVFGWQAGEAVTLAREQVAELVHSEPNEIVFTSGATEAVNLAIKGIFEAYRSKGNHIITCHTEHKAVLDTCAHLEKQGAEVTYLPVGADGRIVPEQLEAAIRPETILVCLMYANNETGVVQPVSAISEIARKHGVLFFCDASQAVGKIPVNVNADGLDVMAFSAHKLYGPKGVGALFVRRKNPRVRLTAQQDGGGHERGLRSGTLNVPGIVGFGKACALCGQQMVQETRALGTLRNQLEARLLSLEAVSVNGSVPHRLPHVTNLSFHHVEAEALLMAVGKEIALSSGSACTSGSLEPSYVLKAMGLSDETAYSSLRFALGRFTTKEEIEFTCERLTGAVTELRSASPSWGLHRAAKAGR